MTVWDGIAEVKLDGIAEVKLDGMADDVDEARAVAVDSAGNVIAASYGENTGTGKKRTGARGLAPYWNETVLKPP